MQSQYLHSAKYGNPGGVHTMKPMFVKRDNHIFKSEYHPDVIANKDEGLKAMYHVKGDKIYTSAAHPDGAGPHAVFRISERGTVHTTHAHPEHHSDQPVFVLGKEKLDQSFIERVMKNA